MIGKMMEKKHKRCANKFSEEDKAELTEMALKIQGYNCFKEMFHSACQKSVKSQVYAFFRHKQWRRLPQRLQQQVLQPRLLLSFVQLDAKNKIYTILSLFLSIFYHLCISAHLTVFQDYF